MLTVIREMAHAVSTHLAHIDRQRLSGAVGDQEQDQLLADVLEVASRGPASARWSERPAARRAGRGRRRRCWRARPGRDPGRDRRGIAGRLRRAAGAPAPRARAHHAAAPLRQPVPVLHQLHRHRHRPRHPVLRPAARGDRRLRPRGRRRGDAEDPCPHRRAGGGGRRLRGGRHVQRLDVADMREQIAAREARLHPAKSGPWRSRPATACARCSRGSAPTWSTAARPSTRRPTRSSPGSTT